MNFREKVIRKFADTKGNDKQYNSQKKKNKQWDLQNTTHDEGY